MQELTQKLINEAGLTPQQAQKAIEIMKEFVSGKVPPMFSGFVNGFFANTGEKTADDIL